jgi:small subunit ribosomal protein S13
MLYLFGANIPSNKRVIIGLTSIYGINYTRSLSICNLLGLSKNLKINQLTKDQISKLIQLIQKQPYKLDADLKKEINTNIKRLIQISCYRGIRHKIGLPVHGQRTHSNARTQRRLRAQRNF